MMRRARNMTLECSERLGRGGGDERFSRLCRGPSSISPWRAVVTGRRWWRWPASIRRWPAGPMRGCRSRSLMALMRAAAVVTDDPAFAAHFGAESQFHEISIVGMISHSAATMAEAFEQMNRYARLVVEVEGHDAGNRFAIVRRDGETWMEDRTRNPEDCPELIESTFARFVWTTKRFLGDVPMAKAVWFTPAAPGACGRDRPGAWRAGTVSAPIATPLPFTIPGCRCRCPIPTAMSLACSSSVPMPCWPRWQQQHQRPRPGGERRADGAAQGAGGDGGDCGDTGHGQVDALSPLAR